VSLGGGGRWILLEPRPGPLSDSLTETVDALAARGFSSLIGHPERHPVEHRLGGRPLLEQRGGQLHQRPAARRLRERLGEVRQDCCPPSVWRRRPGQTPR
jgi:hypothetical protein